MANLPALLPDVSPNARYMDQGCSMGLALPPQLQEIESGAQQHLSYVDFVEVVVGKGGVHTTCTPPCIQEYMSNSTKGSRVARGCKM